jgi:hypothetical protein
MNDKITDRLLKHIQEEVSKASEKLLFQPSVDEKLIKKHLNKLDCREVRIKEYEELFPTKISRIMNKISTKLIKYKILNKRYSSKNPITKIFRYLSDDEGYYNYNDDTCSVFDVIIKPLQQAEIVTIEVQLDENKYIA